MLRRGCLSSAVRRCYGGRISISERERQLLEVWATLPAGRSFSMQSRGRARVEKEIRERERELLENLRKSLRQQERMHKKTAHHLKELRHQIRRQLEERQ